MKIVIISGSFYPNIHPRAFRAAELAKELSRQGHEVTAVFCTREENFDYEGYESIHKIKLIPLNIFNGNRVAEVASHKRTFFYKIERYLIEYLICGNLFKYGKQICAQLEHLPYMEEADAVIALSTPFPCHYGFYKYMKKKGKHFVAIADSGDPFYYSKQTPRAIWFKYLEKAIYNKCDYITIPTINAINQYAPICPKTKIRIIPQGFDMTHLKLFQGSFTPPIKFAYAGVFYWDIRNPEFLFKYLDGISDDYEFHIFMRYADETFNEILAKYPNLKSRVRMKLCVPHDDLIYELSRMHFLINIENLSNTQMPSKLIDYGMAGRPILSCNETNFNHQILNDFFHGNYDNQYIVNVDDFNIKNVASKFMNLITSKITK